MKRSHWMTGVSAVLLLMIVVGCGGSKNIQKPISNIPDWYLSPPSDPNFYYGIGDGTSRKLSIAKNKATNQAMLSISTQIETKFKSLQESFAEEVGTGEDTQLLEQFTEATKAVTSQVLTGLRPMKLEVKENNGEYHAYVMMEMNIAASADALAKKIKQQEQLYTRMRSTETLQRLEEEASKFEEYKKMNP